MVPDDVVQAVRAFAARPQVLVGLDFDGVLAPLVDDRDAARALPGTVEAVLDLARLPHTEVVLVSGRALASLTAVTGVSAGDGVSLVGSHGAEASLRHRPPGRSASIGLTREEGERLDAVTAALRTIVATDPGLDLELKPTAAVLHTRLAADDVAHRAENEALRGPGSWPGVHAIRGKSVVELAVVETSKGGALQRFRTELAVEAVLYAGDDVTDETAFAVLAPGDVGIKVGPGATHAAYRVDGPADVRELLQRLVAERSPR
jgi:trehalose 6-phosphate phosphatase